jgi:8-oxo-dGTP pyrophosphatase MutT (NUDIX family)
MHHVVGFQFNSIGHLVALLHKKRPPAQEGLWNGPGGRVEEGETPLAAMVREFAEETTGSDQGGVVWTEFALLVTRVGDRVSFFSSFTDAAEDLRGTTDEEVGLFPLDFLTVMKEQLVPDVPWLLELALSKRREDGLPSSRVTVTEDAL